MPTHTVSGFDGSTRIAPIDWAWSSKTGSKVVPAFSDFQTPPLAAPTQMVSGSPATASIAEIRPLITAGPIERARSPPKVAESISTSAAPAIPNPAPISATTSRAFFLVVMVPPSRGRGTRCARVVSVVLSPIP